MQKEVITKENIESDIKDYFAFLKYYRSESMGYTTVSFGVFTPLMILCAFLYTNVLTIVFAAVSAVLLAGNVAARIVSGVKTDRELKNALEDHTVQDDKLYSATETLYRKPFKTRYGSRFFIPKRFPDGRVLNLHTGEWGVPPKCFGWSKEFSLSAKGLLNVSVEGDLFWVVSGKDGTIYYAYPQKYFSYAGKNPEEKA